MAKLDVNWKAVESFDLHDCGTPLIVTFKGPGIERVIPLVVDGVHRCAYCWRAPTSWRTPPGFDMASPRLFADMLREGLVAENLAH